VLTNLSQRTNELTDGQPEKLRRMGECIKISHFLVDLNNGRVLGTIVSSVVCLSVCNACIVIERYVVGIGDGTVGMLRR